MCKKLFFLISLLLVLGPPCSASEPSFYISPNGSSSNSGADWNDALRQLPSYLYRGFTYYIADGSYNSYTFDDAPSATYITIKKATIDDHGTDTGWQSSYGDGTALFGNFNFSNTSYIIFDGQVEDGFKLIKEGVGGTVVTIDNSNHITLRNCDLDGNFATLSNDNATSHTNGACHVMHMGGVSYVTIENCKLHDAADDGFSIHGADNLLIAGNQVYNLYGCGTDGGCGPCYNGHSDGVEIFNVDNAEFRGNFIYDVRSTSSFISGNWTTDPGNDSWNVTLVNNIFYSPETGFCIYLRYIHNITLVHNIFWGIKQGSYGGMALGPELTDLDMYNNIILSINYAHMGGIYDPSEHRGDYNLFGYNTAQYPLQAHDIIASDPMFENIPDIDGPAHREVMAEDFRIISTSAAKDSGTDMGITVDFFGNVRPQDSGYDIGAHEYVTPRAGDFNGDGVVDFKDLKILADDWLVSDYDLAGSLSTGLVSHYKFDGDASDSVGDNDGTEVGNPTYSTGLHGQAISLDGDGDYVNCGNDASFDITGSITLSALIKGTFNGSWDPIISKGFNWQLTKGMGNEASFFCIGLGSILGTTNINDDQWHHVAAVYNGSKMCLYVDGVREAYNSASGSLSVSASSVYIGGSPSQSFNGLIDDVLIYNRALSEEEIQELACPIDLNMDGSVNFKDFAELADNWLR